MSHTHGPQHDNFRTQSGIHHGGATFDEGFRAAAESEAHGKLYDQFAKRPGVDRYGERWDHFPWQDVSPRHGTNHDSGFGGRTAHTGEHGTWHDAFQGAAVRYMAGGRDYEGVVISCHDDHLVVNSREGERHEVVVDQILQRATLSGNPNEYVKPVAGPGHTDTSVVGGPQGERPSGESSTAMGGGRSAVDPGVVDSKFANKAAPDGVDVAKEVDSSETATQGGKRWCKKCRHYCRRPQDGRCPECNTPVQDVTQKTWDAGLDVIKELSA